MLRPLYGFICNGQYLELHLVQEAAVHRHERLNHVIHSRGRELHLGLAGAKCKPKSPQNMDNQAWSVVSLQLMQSESLGVKIKVI